MIHGIVTNSETKSGVLVLNVRVSRAGITYENVPVVHQFPGHVQSITEDSRVLMEQTEDNLWVVIGVLETDQAELPESVSEYEQVMSFDDGTEISVRPKDDSTEESPTGYNIKISASGDMNIETGGHLQFKASSIDFDTSGGA
jgi:hypothetical protein